MRTLIIKLNTCYHAICQVQELKKNLDNDSRLMLEQSKRGILNCIEKCKCKAEYKEVSEKMMK